MLRSRMKALWAPKDKSERHEAMEQFGKELGQRVRSERVKTGMTQEDVADKLKISTEQISRYETGGVTIDVATLIGLSHAIGFSISDMLESFNGKSEEPLSAGAAAVGRIYDSLSDDASREAVKQLAIALRNSGKRQRQGQ